MEEEEHRLDHRRKIFCVYYKILAEKMDIRSYLAG